MSWESPNASKFDVLSVMFSETKNCGKQHSFSFLVLFTIPLKSLWPSDGM